MAGLGETYRVINVRETELINCVLGSLCTSRVYIPYSRDDTGFVQEGSFNDFLKSAISTILAAKVRKGSGQTISDDHGAKLATDPIHNVDIRIDTILTDYQEYSHG